MTMKISNINIMHNLVNPISKEVHAATTPTQMNGFIHLLSLNERDIAHISSKYHEHHETPTLQKCQKIIDNKSNRLTKLENLSRFVSENITGALKVREGRQQKILFKKDKIKKKTVAIGTSSEKKLIKESRKFQVIALGQKQSLERVNIKNLLLLHHTVNDILSDTEKFKESFLNGFSLLKKAKKIKEKELKKLISFETGKLVKKLSKESRGLITEAVFKEFDAYFESIKKVTHQEITAHVIKLSNLFNMNVLKNSNRTLIDVLEGNKKVSIDPTLESYIKYFGDKQNYQCLKNEIREQALEYLPKILMGPEFGKKVKKNEQEYTKLEKKIVIKNMNADTVIIKNNDKEDTVIIKKKYSDEQKQKD